MSQNSQNISIKVENDPLEAIFALNMGDFMTEHLISNELLNKIDTSVKDKIERLKGQLKELTSIYSLDKTLTLLGFDSEEEHIIYNAIARTITQIVNTDSCDIYLTPEFVKGSAGSADLVKLGSSAPDGKKGFLSLSDTENPLIKSFLDIETQYLKKDKSVILAIPLVNNWGRVGVIGVYCNTYKEIPLELIRLLEVTANLFVTSMRLQKLIEETEEAVGKEDSSPADLRHLRAELTASIGDLGDEQQQFVEALAEAVDSKSKAKEHSKNVAGLARKICDHLELNEKTSDLIYYAGLLHNIGQISLSEEIFSSKEKPSREIWNKLQNHPNIGVNLLMKINFLSEVIPYVHYHKERWDGQGVPEGLSGMSIPLGARIIAVADAYQAMVSERSYRKSISNKEVLDIIKQESGIKWDPVIVNALYEIKAGNN